MQLQMPVAKLQLLTFFLILTCLISCSDNKSTNPITIDITEIATNPATIDVTETPTKPTTVSVTEIARIPETYGLKNVSWSPDATKLATSEVGGIRIWQLDTDNTNGNLENSVTNVTFLPAQTEKRIESLSWANDNSVIVGGSVDGVWLWDPTTANNIKELDHDYGARSFTWPPDGMFMATSSNDGKVRIWDIVNDWNLSDIPVSIQDTIREVAWSPDGRWIATTEANEVNLWEAETGKLILTLKGHQDIVGHIDWSPDSNQLASTSDDKTIIIWDIGSGTQQHNLEHGYYVSEVAWSPNGTILASGDGEGNIYLWNPNNGDKLIEFEGLSDSITDLDWANDNKMLASASLFIGMANIWEIELDESQ